MMSQVCRSLAKFITPTRGNIAKRSFATLPPEVVIFPNREMAVCWHPEENFPYECTKSLPIKKIMEQSVLKIREKDVKEIFGRKKNNKEMALELAKITYTTMHRWFPRSRDKKAKKTAKDRPYL